MAKTSGKEDAVESDGTGQGHEVVQQSEYLTPRARRWLIIGLLSAAVLVMAGAVIRNQVLPADGVELPGRVETASQQVEADRGDARESERDDAPNDGPATTAGPPTTQGPTDDAADADADLDAADLGATQGPSGSQPPRPGDAGAGELPPVTVPPATVPGVSLPPVSLPPVSLPPVTLPPLTIPLLPGLPPITLPPIVVPPVTVPPVSVPVLPLPRLDLPQSTVPQGSLPVDLPPVLP